MNKSLRWKLILAFVLIFLAGAACGFFGAVHMHRAFFAHMAPDSMAQHMKERMRVELRLTRRFSTEDDTRSNDAKRPRDPQPNASRDAATPNPGTAHQIGGNGKTPSSATAQTRIHAAWPTVAVSVGRLIAVARKSYL
jgi:hypothetical protein